MPILLELASTLRVQFPSWAMGDACADLVSSRYKLRAWNPQEVCSGADSLNNQGQRLANTYRPAKDTSLAASCKDRILRKAGSHLCGSRALNEFKVLVSEPRSQAAPSTMSTVEIETEREVQSKC